MDFKQRDKVRNISDYYSFANRQLSAGSPVGTRTLQVISPLSTKRTVPSHNSQGGKGYRNNITFDTIIIIDKAVPVPSE